MKNLNIVCILILFCFNIKAQINIKWEETFSDSIVPVGWQVIDNDQSGQGLDLYPSVTPQGGTTVYPQADQYLWSSNYQNANLAGVIDEWLISPQISVIYAADSLYFWAGAMGGPFDDSLRVWISTSGNQISDFNHLLGYLKVDGPVGTWHKYGFSLSQFDSSDIYFAINYYIQNGGSGGQHSDCVWIDHCNITGDPATINQPPIAFNLLRPRNYTILHPIADSTIVFKWFSSNDIDGDTLKYRLKILDLFPPLVYNNLTDTTFSFNWHGYLNHYSIYRWTVSVTDGKSTVCSPDTFIFITPPIENLPPFSFSLLSPANGDTLFTKDTVMFKWHKSIDPNSDTLLYDLNITSNNLDTSFINISDTSYLISNTGIFDYNHSYQWTVSASDNQYSTSCSNPYTFKIVNSLYLKNNTEKIPNQFVLYQNYPNPFNPRTNIQFSIPKTEIVTLKIYNLLGQEVATLVSNKLNPGNYTYTWDASGFASGVYLYKIEAGSFVESKKLLLLK